MFPSHTLRFTFRIKVINTVSSTITNLEIKLSGVSLNRLRLRRLADVSVWSSFRQRPSCRDFFHQQILRPSRICTASRDANRLSNVWQSSVIATSLLTISAVSSLTAVDGRPQRCEWSFTHKFIIYVCWVCLHNMAFTDTPQNIWICWSQKLGLQTHLAYPGVQTPYPVMITDILLTPVSNCCKQLSLHVKFVDNNWLHTRVWI